MNLTPSLEAKIEQMMATGDYDDPEAVLTEALRLLAELKQGQKSGSVQATSFINPNLALGNYDEALAWFERAYQRREGILQWIKVHPFFDPVRDDPRFKDLVRRVGPT